MKTNKTEENKRAQKRKEMKKPPEKNEETSLPFIVPVLHTHQISEVASFAHKNICRFAFTKQPPTPSGSSLDEHIEMISSTLLNIPADRGLVGEVPACLIANGTGVGQMIPSFPKAQMRVSSGNFFRL